MNITSLTSYCAEALDPQIIVNALQACKETIAHACNCNAFKDCAPAALCVFKSLITQITPGIELSESYWTKIAENLDNILSTIHSIYSNSLSINPEEDCTILSNLLEKFQKNFEGDPSIYEKISQAVTDIFRNRIWRVNHSPADLPSMDEQLLNICPPTGYESVINADKILSIASSVAIIVVTYKILNKIFP